MAKGKFETHVLPNLEKIELWVRKGATQEEVARKLGLSERGLRGYLACAEAGEERYLPLLRAYARARARANDDVEAALFKRATGFEREKKVFEKKINPESGEFEEVLVRREVLYIPPDPVSIQFWLTNMWPERWKHRPQGGGGQEDRASGVIVLPVVPEEPEEEGADAP